MATSASKFVNLNKIRKERLNLKISQKAIASHIGISVYSYNRKEKGKQKFDSDEIYLISKFFNKPLEYFFENDIA